MQWTLRDVITKEATNLTQIGSLNETDTDCQSFGFNATIDFLHIVRVGFNATGVYGIELETHNNVTFAAGIDTQYATLRDVTWGFPVGEDDSHSSAFVGFDGTYLEKEVKTGTRISSLRAIFLDLNCNMTSIE